MGLSLLDINDELGRHAPSWYAASAKPLNEFPQAEGSQKFDVCIIGAGFSGLSSALHLSELGYNVCVLDAQRVGWGASGRNGGQVGTGQRVAQDELEAIVGDNLARDAFQIGVDAATLVRTLITKHQIDCAYKSGSIEAFHKKRYDKHGVEEVEHLKTKYDYHSVSYLSPDEMTQKVGSPDYSAGVLDTHAGHLHPLDYARGLARAATTAGAQIFEMSRVSGVAGGKPCTVKTDKAEITADHVILAANGYLGNLDGKVASRVMPINNFIVATEPLDDAACKALIRDGECVHDSRFVVNYFRISEDNRMLFGGGENYTYKFPTDIVKTVRRPMLKVFPQLADARIDYAWGGTLAITYKRLPHFEFRKDGIVNISGYSGSGVHMATMAGKIAADGINGQMAKFDIMSKMPTPKFPGGTALRWPLLPLALTWYAMRDRL
ncbi:MAG: NAD(P)/FAD-dependent oxidoreductase [Rhizobiaceae bacterium]